MTSFLQKSEAYDNEAGCYPTQSKFERTCASTLPCRSFQQHLITQFILYLVVLWVAILSTFLMIASLAMLILTMSSLPVIVQPFCDPPSFPSTNRTTAKPAGGGRGGGRGGLDWSELTSRGDLYQPPWLRPRFPYADVPRRRDHPVPEITEPAVMDLDLFFTPEVPTTATFLPTTPAEGGFNQPGDQSPGLRNRPELPTTTRTTTPVTTTPTTTTATTTTETTVTDTTMQPTTTTDMIKPMPIKDAIEFCKNKDQKNLITPTTKAMEEKLYEELQSSNVGGCEWVWLGFRARPEYRYQVFSRDGPKYYRNYGTFAAEERNEGKGGIDNFGNRHDEKIGEPYEGADILLLTKNEIDGEFRLMSKSDKFQLRPDMIFDQTIYLMTKRQGAVCETHAYQCIYRLADNKTDTLINRIKNAEFEDGGRRALFLFDFYHEFPDKRVYKMEIENEVIGEKIVALSVSIRHNYNFIEDPKKNFGYKPLNWRINDGEHDCVAMEMATGIIYTQSCDTDFACPYCV